MRLIYSFLLIFITQLCFANADAFITTWDASNSQFTYYAGKTGDNLNYDIYYEKVDEPSESGTISNITDTSYTVTELKAGTYRVEVTGNFGIYISNGTNKLKLKSIEQWGTNQWTSMENAFYGCNNLAFNATDTPDFSQCTNFENMFGFCHTTTGNLDNWSFAPNTSLTRMFDRATNFNIDISSWDVSNVVDMSLMFFNTQKFNQDISIWDVSNVTNMAGMFQGATSFNQNLNNWGDKTSNVKKTNKMFLGASAFNSDISEWNVSRVDSMAQMFDRAASFNQDLNNWNVSNVKNMALMFSGAASFNQNLNNWDVSNVKDMSFMFAGATIFNGDISDWDVDNVTDMNSLFSSARAFNQDLNDWNVSNVTNMVQTFHNASDFNGDISNWVTSNVTNMEGMFNGATIFNGDISDWDVANVTNMEIMFLSAKAFNQDLNWNVSSVTNMERMFLDAATFNGNISEWNVQNVTTMERMFSATPKFNQDISSWNTSSVEKMSFMFNNAQSFNQDISSWNVSNVEAMSSMFNGARIFNQSLGAWTFKENVDLSNFLLNSGVSIGNVNSSLQGWKEGDNVPSNITIDLSTLSYTDTESLDDLRNTYNWTINGGTVADVSVTYFETWWTSSADGEIVYGAGNGENLNYTIEYYLQNDPSQKTTISNITDPETTITGLQFEKTYILRITGNYGVKIDPNDKGTLFKIQQWGINQWENLEEAFRGSDNLIVLGVPDLSKCTNAQGMFRDCGTIQGQLNNWTFPNSANLSSMFRDCNTIDVGFTHWRFGDSTDLSNFFYNVTSINGTFSDWSVSGVMDMEGMFFGASSFNQNISSWDVSKVTNMNSMFNRARAFNQDISNWNTSKVTDMGSMFRYTDTFNQDISNWNTANVETMSYMFDSAKVFNRSLGNWELKEGVNLVGLLNNSRLSSANYEATLAGWASAESVPNDITLEVSVVGMEYCDDTYRQQLINDHNWKIDGDTNVDECPFVTIWETNDGTIIYPAGGGSGLNYEIYYEQIDNPTINGTINSTQSQETINGLENGKKYRLEVRGTFDIKISDGTEKLKLKKVEQWGSNKWQNMEFAFHGCENLEITATDIPDFSECIGFRSMFNNCTNLQGNFQNWSFKENSVLTGMFVGASNFNSDISSWDVSNVINMEGMFAAAGVFNQDISKWNVSNVTNMNSMFQSAFAFDQNIGNWNFSSINQINGILAGTNLSVENYDNFLFALDEQQLENIDLGDVTGLEYCYGDLARKNLVDNKSWTISGDMNVGGSANESNFSIGDDKINCNNYITLRATTDHYPVFWRVNGDGVLYIDTLTSASDSSLYFPTENERLTKAQIKVIGYSLLSNDYCHHDIDTLTINLDTHPSVITIKDTSSTEVSITINATINNALQQIWTTSGNGDFDDDSAINTTYTPSQEDKDFGAVRLTLSTIDGECEETSDDIVIGLKECGVSIEPIILNNNTVIFKAIANNDRIIHSYLWSFGDGITGRANVTEHTYQNTGVYSVSVTAQSQDSVCTVSANTSVEITDIEKEVYSTSGKVLVNGAELDEGIVSVFYISPENRYEVYAEDTIRLGDNGNYYFEHLPKGRYYIMAYATSTELGTTIPTFYGNTDEWTTADQLSLTSNETDIDIELVTFNAPTPSYGSFVKPSSVAGYFTGLSIMQKNVVFQTEEGQESGKTRKLVKEPIPVKNAIILLYDYFGSLITFTTTDNYGDFSFTSLQAGIYELEIKYIGTSESIKQEVVIDGDEDTIDNYSFVLEQPNVKRDDEIVALNNSANDLGVSFFPNPVINKVWVNSSLYGKEYTMYSVDGAKLESGVLKIQLDFRSLNHGIYLIKVDNQTFKVVK
ncbi:MAG: BspA family leucine-rich repeat surface protein [Cytophagales bacterium]|nr:BspA family leucine-rich repeat surface protein [Cytophagales bacterium]